MFGVEGNMGQKVNLIDHLEEVRKVFMAEFSCIPCFSSVIDQWQQLISKASTEREKPAVSLFKGEVCEETYIHTIVFPNGKEFEFEWDIVRAVDWIQKHNMKKERIWIPPILPYMNKTVLNFCNPANATPQHPVIVIHTCLIAQDLIVINGNHRIAEAFRNGISVVDGYFIRNHEHREWMLSEEMKLYYEFLMDFQLFEKEFLSIQHGKTHCESDFYATLNVSKRIHKC